MSQGQTPAGWYHAEGDPPGTTRYWDGTQWVGEPQPSTPQAAVPPTGQPMQVPPMNTAAGGGFGQGEWAGAVTAPRLAEVSARIGGRLLDSIVWFFLWLIANLPTVTRVFSEAFDAAIDGEDPPPVEISLTSLLLSGLVTMILVVSYEVFMNSRSKGTLGKRATSSKIVKLDGSDIDDATAFRRMIPYLVVHVAGLAIAVLASDAGSDGTLLLLLLGGLVGLIMIFADSRRQAPWDKVARTLVVVR